MIRQIFVVDDNADYQFIFFKVLKGFDKSYSAKFFENAKACHRHIETLQVIQEPLPALLVLDLNMPGINGLQLLRMLKSPAFCNGVIIEQIPVVIMSHEFSNSQILQCYQAGANAVIQKPTDYQVLKYTIHSICRFWLDRNMD